MNLNNIKKKIQRVSSVVQHYYSNEKAKNN